MRWPGVSQEPAPLLPRTRGILDQAGVARTGRIRTTFTLRLAHPALTLRRMLGASGALDAYDGCCSGHLIVNVLESLPESTVLHVKPSCPLTFVEIADEVDAMVARVGKDHGIDGLRVAGIAWTVRLAGIPVQDRAGFGTIA